MFDFNFNGKDDAFDSFIGNKMVFGEKEDKSEIDVCDDDEDEEDDSDDEKEEDYQNDKDMIGNSEEISMNPEENYIEFRTALTELEDRAKICKDFDDYNQTVGAMLVYSLKFLIIESNLSELVAKKEMIVQMKTCHIDLEDKDQFDVFYENVIDEKSGWTFTAKAAAEDAGSMGLGMFWIIVVMGVNKIEDNILLNRIITTYCAYLITCAGYLSSKYGNRMFSDKANLYTKNLLLKLEKFINSNKGINCKIV